MTSNYVHGRFIIGIKCNENGTIENINEYSDDEEDINYNILKDLYDANVSNNLDEYKKIFNNYISNPNIYGWFSYTDHPPSSCERQFYPLCKCNIDEEKLIKIHKGYYEAGCNCEDGKRYIALRNAYEIAAKRDKCLITFEISMFLKMSNTNFENDEIIKWIESTGPVDKMYKEWIFNNK